MNLGLSQNQPENNHVQPKSRNLKLDLEFKTDAYKSNGSHDPGSPFQTNQTYISKSRNVQNHDRSKHLAQNI